MSKSGWRVANKTFSDKHRELFPYLAQNKTDREIAAALGIRTSTVYQRIEKMMDVIKCAGRADLEEYCKQQIEQETQEA